MSPPSKTRFQQLVEDQLESHYQSHQREPLGASYKRGLPIPQDATFGKPSTSCPLFCHLAECTRSAPSLPLRSVT